MDKHWEAYEYPLRDIVDELEISGQFCEVLSCGHIHKHDALTGMCKKRRCKECPKNAVHWVESPPKKVYPTECVECGGEVVALGLCWMHYQRQRRARLERGT